MAFLSPNRIELPVHRETGWGILSQAHLRPQEKLKNGRLRMDHCYFTNCNPCGTADRKTYA